jgi:hypothetical protein
VESVTVAVHRDGFFIASIERPLHHVQGHPAVKYKRRLWLVENGILRLERGPIQEDADFSPEQVVAPASSPTALVINSPDICADPVEDDDSDVRQRIVEALPTARMLIEAGPGTGKTEMAARRLAHLVSQHLTPGEILVLSFSRSAVRTLTRRFSQLNCDERVLEELRFLSVRTFDSWAFHMLRRLGYQPSQLLRNGHDANIQLLVDAAAGPDAEVLRKLIGNKKHLIVDEFQDLPGVRGDLVLALLDLLAPRNEAGSGFTVLGDPAQAIYSFASGNRPDGSGYPTAKEYWNEIQSRYRDCLQVEELHRNYRAGPALAKLSARLRKVLLSGNAAQDSLEAVLSAITALPESAEPLSPAFMDASAEGSRAILTRTNGEALQVLRALSGHSVTGPRLPIRLRAGHCAPLPPAWIGGLLCQLRANSLQRAQFGRIYSHLCSQWSAETQKSLGLPSESAAWGRLAHASGRAADDSSIPVDALRERLLWPDAFPDDQAALDQGLVITTVHQSKGMEFDLVTLLEGPESSAEDNQDNRAEAASVAYVGITRAGRSLDRVPRNQIHRPLRQREFRRNRQRLYNHWAGRVNFEIGLPGDIDHSGFIDPDMHNGPDAVAELQRFLLENASGLEGHKVILCKEMAGDEAFWKIHLQQPDNSCGRLLGRTASQLTHDLLYALHPKYVLPRRIYNLRISSVGTVCGASGDVPLSTEGASRLWLGTGLFGSGDFKPIRRTNG